jgi:hypothetical protein
MGSFPTVAAEVFPLPSSRPAWSYKQTMTFPTVAAEVFQSSYRTGSFPTVAAEVFPLPSS